MVCSVCHGKHIHNHYCPNNPFRRQGQEKHSWKKKLTNQGCSSTTYADFKININIQDIVVNEGE